jgi:hypothetical protein
MLCYLVSPNAGPSGWTLSFMYFARAREHEIWSSSSSLASLLRVVVCGIGGMVGDPKRCNQHSTGTHSLIVDFKLLAQHTKLCEVKNLYVVFLDLQQKAHYAGPKADTRDFGGVSEPSSRRSGVETRWYRSKAASTTNLLMLGEGVRCGEFDSPIISNIVIDAIIRDIEACRPKETATADQLFYADDGDIMDTDPEKVQRLTEDYTERFLRVGLANDERQENQGDGSEWGESTGHDVKGGV